MKVRTQYVGAAALSVAISLMGFASSSVGAVTAHTDPILQVLYDATTSPLPPNLPSQAFEATETSEFGNLVQFAAHSARTVNVVNVTMSSWGCESGNWSTANCVTTPGSGFSEPITFNIYNVGPSNTVGSLIASQTQTFQIAYRPTSTPGLCGGDTGAWASLVTDQCYHGLDVPISFNFPGVAVPDQVIYGIAYNTSDYGYHPYGDATACHSSSGGCGYDSLNVSLSTLSAPVVGTDPLPGTTFLNSTYSGNFCDNGTGGLGTLRLDAIPSSGPCANPFGGWSVNGPGPNDGPWYVPAVSFSSQLSSAPAFSGPTSVVYAAKSHAFTTSLTATGFPTPSVALTAGSVPGLHVSGGVSGTITVSGTPTALGLFSMTFTATNAYGTSTEKLFVSVGAAPAIWTVNHFSVRHGQPFLFRVSTHGTPKPALSETGALPAGVSFVDIGNGSASLAGLAATAGTYVLHITATSVSGTATQTFTLKIR